MIELNYEIWRGSGHAYLMWSCGIQGRAVDPQGKPLARRTVFAARAMQLRKHLQAKCNEIGVRFPSTWGIRSP